MIRIEIVVDVFFGGHVLSVTYDDAVRFGRVDAISALYASPRVINEYYLDSDEVAGIEFSSEWVINFPTKRFYVDTNPALPDGALFVGAVRAPFYTTFNNWVAPNVYNRTNGSCHEVRIRLYDREERTTTTTTGFSPRPPGQARDTLCWEAQVITFNQRDAAEDGEPSNILGSTYFQNIQTNFDHGWGYVEFVMPDGTMPMSRYGYTPADDTPVRFGGLPVTGFFATNADNAMHEGASVLANYSALFRHRTERAVDIDS